MILPRKAPKGDSNARASSYALGTRRPQVRLRSAAASFAIVPHPTSGRGFMSLARGLAMALRLSFLVALVPMLIQIPRACSAPKDNVAPIVSAAMIGPLLSRDIDTTLAQGGVGPPRDRGASPLGGSTTPARATTRTAD